MADLRDGEAARGFVEQQKEGGASERAGDLPKAPLGVFEQARATMQPRPKPATGLPMARLADETQAGLRAALPSFAAAANPVDLTAALLTNSRLFSESCPSSRAIPQRTRS